MSHHEVTTREAWLVQRRALLAQEKAFLRAKDELAAARRALPWVRVDKRYELAGPGGPRTLPELFDGRSQLIVYHFMYGPQAERPCKSCSFWADHIEAVFPHLAGHDVAFAVVSRGPLAKLTAFGDRMGWTFPWLSSATSDFAYDFGTSFRDGERAAGQAVYNYQPLAPGEANDLPGISVFTKDADGAVFHTYSTYGRGLDLMNAAYQYLDLTPKGRNEEGLSFPMAWVKYHDEYRQPA
jgi:predicted dithiol-disulfide oxidoreductase (DUF899 family)